MNDNKRVSGNTTVAPDVLETIIQMTANETKGISRIYNNSGNNNGVKLKIIDGTVNAEIYVILNANNNSTSEVCNELQKNIARAIQEMVGMEVGSLNIHVEDFDFEETL